MKRVSAFALVVVLLAALAGCQQPPESPAPSPQPQPSPPASPTDVQPTADINFAKWPTATEGSVSVNQHVARMCAMPLSPDHAWAGDGGKKRHGPHFEHYIVIRVSPEAMDDFKTMEAALPVGTTIVKEKHTDSLAKGPPNEYAAMIKREQGYDPEHGDWEYLYVVREPEKKVTRGRLESCIECHAHAKDRDYVFRTYLPGKVKGVSEW